MKVKEFRRYVDRFVTVPACNTRTEMSFAKYQYHTVCSFARGSAIQMTIREMNDVDVVCSVSVAQRLGRRTSDLAVRGSISGPGVRSGT